MSDKRSYSPGTVMLYSLVCSRPCTSGYSRVSPCYNTRHAQHIIHCIFSRSRVYELCFRRRGAVLSTLQGTELKSVYFTCIFNCNKFIFCVTLHLTWQAFSCEIINLTSAYNTVLNIEYHDLTYEKNKWINRILAWHKAQKPAIMIFQLSVCNPRCWVHAL